MKTFFGDDPSEPLIFAGYEASNIEFANVFNDADLTGQPLRDRFEALIETAVTAESGLVLGTFLAILIVGHADRDDTLGHSPEQRRQVELVNSGLRADSAEAFIFNRIIERLAEEGFTPPEDIAQLQSTDIRKLASGSADLVHLTPGNDEGQRKANRRVQIFGTAFTP